MTCDGKVALVTGAGAGIGQACALALAQAGAWVFASDIDDAAAQQTAQLIADKGGEAHALAQDVTLEHVWIDVIAEIEKQKGRLDILVNNAGIAIAAAVTEMSLADWRRQNAVNIDGVFLGTKHAIPLMAQHAGGSIINLSSIAGLKGAPMISGYCASKGAVRLFTKAVALECVQAGHNIRVNSVHPGIIDTPLWDKEVAPVRDMMPELAPEGANRMDMQNFSDVVVPGGKLGTPEDIANVIVFLASDAASYMTGSEVVVDHALTAR